MFGVGGGGLDGISDDSLSGTAGGGGGVLDGGGGGGRERCILAGDFEYFAELVKSSPAVGGQQAKAKEVDWFRVTILGSSR